VKARQQIETSAGNGQRRAFTPAVILLSHCQRRKTRSTRGDPAGTHLPRRCPVCRDDTIIGHGRRLRQSHDDQHECIWVRRGICEPCRKTFTILPDWRCHPATTAFRSRLRRNQRQQGPECHSVSALPEKADRFWSAPLALQSPGPSVHDDRNPLSGPRIQNDYETADARVAARTAGAAREPGSASATCCVRRDAITACVDSLREAGAKTGQVFLRTHVHRYAQFATVFGWYVRSSDPRRNLNRDHSEIGLS
jgi:hypothetical protein